MCKCKPNYSALNLADLGPNSEKAGDDDDYDDDEHEKNKMV